MISVERLISTDTLQMTHRQLFDPASPPTCHNKHFEGLSSSLARTKVSKRRIGALSSLSRVSLVLLVFLLGSSLDLLSVPRAFASPLTAQDEFVPRPMQDRTSVVLDQDASEARRKKNELESLPNTRWFKQIFESALDISSYSEGTT